MTLDIGSVDRMPEDFGRVVSASEAEGFSLVSRLANDWASGANRFDAPGEALFVAHAGWRTVGCCGLNVDPYTAGDRIGRVRHLYVLPDHRRRGVGTALVDHVIRLAAGSFDELRLRTRHSAAAAFYEAVGFDRVHDDESCTHRMQL